MNTTKESERLQKNCLIEIIELINNCVRNINGSDNLSEITHQFTSLTKCDEFIVYSDKNTKHYGGSTPFWFIYNHKKSTIVPQKIIANSNQHSIIKNILSKSDNCRILKTCTLMKEFGLLGSHFVESSNKLDDSIVVIIIGYQHSLQYNFIERILHYTLPHLNSLFFHLREQCLKQDHAPNLTKREQEILFWIIQGKSTWDISKILAISERTVKFHLSNIFKKLDAVNRVQAITKALNLNLIQLMQQPV
ncbi:helix-turn-helix transcriptional regulator [Spartinivicinus poritis]|uniref:helix-turn-helix transcriptional regulator n=1 Tax=Spartinivicinus poritis TaxID=2994640 RepID=UPI00237CDFBA|nr:helix-turn-helix transcriptional regulator [Spartinivicinus sp. A2-2]